MPRALTIVCGTSATIIAAHIVTARVGGKMSFMMRETGRVSMLKKNLELERVLAQ